MLLTSCATLDRQAASAIAKGDIDQREYHLLEMDNRLRVLLISDPEAEKAAASMDLHFGSGADPEDRQGLAHFLEHMLFLGTKKYPEAGEYQAFIAAHGGRHNAYTAFEHTNYIFDVDAKYLEPALDRFAQFFISPLFTEHYVEREKNAVNSEYSARSKNEYRRSLDALKQVVNPDHPFAKFSVGSLQTLSDDDTQVRDDLLTFYEQHYSANVMTLVIMGREPLAQLESMAKEKFSSVPDRNLQIPDIKQPLFLEGTLPARLSIKPEKDLRQLSITFPIADTQSHYRVKPISYIGNIVGHEGKGSLLSLLKSQGLAEMLSAGEGLSYRGGATFDITIGLTEAGLARVDDVVTLVYQTLNRIRDDGVQQWLFAEQAQMADVQFRFMEKKEHFHYVSRLASDMHYYNERDLLRGAFMMSDFDADLIKTFLDQLQVENSLVKLVSKEVVTDKQSPWFHAPYSFRPVNQETLQRWKNAGLNPQITLPEPNPFIPEKLLIQTPRQAESKPQLLKDDPNHRLWYNQDALFPVPKSNFFFSVRSPLASDTASNAALAELYVLLLNDRLNEFAYPAQLAGLSFSLSKHARGFSVRVSGYSEKQALLLERIVSGLAVRDFDGQRFSNLKEELLRSWRNAAHAEPYRLLMRDLRTVLYQPYWTEKELLEALQGQTLDDLEKYIERFWEAVDIESFVNGNTSRKEALAISGLIERLLPGQAISGLPPIEVVHLPAEKKFAWQTEVEHSDAASILYLQGDDNDFAAQALMALSGQILESPFYKQLRTEQQFGYVVWASYMPILTVPGIVFVVQSPAYSVADIDVAIEQFIAQFVGQVRRLTETEFEKHKRALIHQLLQKPQNLYEQTEEFWLAIALDDKHFERKVRVAAAVEQLSLEDWQTFYAQKIQSDSRRQLLLRTVPEKAVKTLVHEEIMIEQPKLFKQQQTFFTYP